MPPNGFVENLHHKQNFPQAKNMNGAFFNLYEASVWDISSVARHETNWCGEKKEYSFRIQR